MAADAGSIELRYRPELDGVRAVAILCVMAYHAFLVAVPPKIAGFMGVDVFFVLSGFLITTLLLDERRSRGNIGLGAFYARRALRLVPALLLMLVVAAGFEVALHRPHEMASFKRVAAETLFYVGNWQPRTLGILNHTWSLAIEEQFYVVWPPLLVFALRRRVSRRTLAAILVGLAVVLFAGDALFGHTGLYHSKIVEVFAESYTRSAAILLGCAIALVPDLWRWARLRSVAVAALAGAAIVLSVSGTKTNFHYRIGLTAFTVLVSVLLAHVVHAPKAELASVLRWKPFVAIGRVSYGLYLYHVPVFWYVGQAHIALQARGLAIAVAITVAITLFSYFAIERPALRYKRRFTRRELEPQTAHSFKIAA